MECPVIKICTTSSGDPMGILVVENEALKMTIEDLERHIATRDAKLRDAEAALKKAIEAKVRVQNAFLEIKQAVEDAEL